jgi:hypothetical protein
VELTIDNVVSAGNTYDPADNVENSDQVVIP